MDSGMGSGWRLGDPESRSPCLQPAGIRTPAFPHPPADGMPKIVNGYPVGASFQTTAHKAQRSQSQMRFLLLRIASLVLALVSLFLIASANRLRLVHPNYFADGTGPKMFLVILSAALVAYELLQIILVWAVCRKTETTTPCITLIIDQVCAYLMFAAAAVGAHDCDLNYQWCMSFEFCLQYKAGIVTSFLTFAALAGVAWLSSSSMFGQSQL